VVDQEAAIGRLEVLLESEGLHDTSRAKLQDSLARKVTELERYKMQQKRMKDKLHHECLALQMTTRHHQRESIAEERRLAEKDKPFKGSAPPNLSAEFDWSRYGNMGSSSSGLATTHEIDAPQMFAADSEVRRSEYDKQTERLELSKKPLTRRLDHGWEAGDHSDSSNEAVPEGYAFLQPPRFEKGELEASACNSEVFASLTLTQEEAYDGRTKGENLQGNGSPLQAEKP
jgi:hypothetical protein